ETHTKGSYAQTDNGSNAGIEGDTTDGGSFTISAPDGLWNLQIGGVDVYVDGVYQQDAVVNGKYGQVAITGVTPGENGSYTVTYDYTLEQNADHKAPASGADKNTDFPNASGPESFDISVSDKDGDTDTGTLNVTIVDDIPTALNPDDLSIGNGGNGSGDLNAVWGADGPHDSKGATFRVEEGADSGLTSNGVAITYHPNEDGTVLVAKAGDKPIFTVTLDAENGTYSVDMQGTVDLETTISTLNCGDAHGGNKPLGYLSSSEGLTYTEPGVDSRIAVINASGPINNSTNGMGVGDAQSFDPGEWITFNFTKPQTVIEFSLGKKGDNISGTWEATDAEGNPYSGTFSTVDGKIVIDNNGQVFSSLTLTATKGGGVIASVGCNTTKTELDVDTTLPIQIMDGDGDILTGNLDLTFTGTDSTSPVLATDDVNSINEDTSWIVSGDLLSNDYPEGADITSVEGATAVDGVITVAGEYGVLTVQPGGEYSYQLFLDMDPSDPLYNAEGAKAAQDLFASNEDGNLKLTESFDYHITDGSKNADATLTIDLTPNKFQAGGTGNDSMTGGWGDDVMVGDPGGATPGVVETVTHKYNVNIIVDNSTSMTSNNSDKMSETRKALFEAVKQLEAYEDATPGEQNITLSFTVFAQNAVTTSIELGGARGVCFQAGKQFFATEAGKTTFINGDGDIISAIPSKTSGTYYTINPDGTIIKTVVTGNWVTGWNSKSSSVSDVTKLGEIDWDAAKCIMGMEGKGGGTNYQKAFETSDAWFDGLNNNNENIVFFLTDGIPTRDNDGDGDSGSRMSSHEFESALTAFNTLVSEHGAKVNAIGVGSGINKDVLQYFDNTNSVGDKATTFENKTNANYYEGDLNGVTVTKPAGEATIVKEASTLGKIFSGLIEQNITNPEAANLSEDTISGGDGSDLIFGDAMNADFMLSPEWKAANPWTPGEKLIAGNSLAIITAYLDQTHPGWTKDDLRQFIEDNAFKLGMNETVERSGSANDQLFGDGGNDTIFGQAGNDSISGGDGNDVIVGGKGNDMLSGGEGSDVFVFYKGDGTDVITDYNTEEGDIIVKVDKGDGSFGTVIDNQGSEITDGVHVVKDILQGENVSAPTDDNYMLVGTGGSDNLTGGAGDDILLGGRGDDILNGGLGDDIMFGGAGKDTFEWNIADLDNGTDKIMDFNLDEGDKISLGDLLPQDNSLDELLNSEMIKGEVKDDYLELTIKHDAGEQTIEVHFEGDSGANFINDYNNAATADDQAAMVNQIIQSMFN
ncbi:type I secretion C-terminal target domain-containing protein, partial [Desulfovibrio sp. OttesenSCG-928-I05]|nr:type I secretion C-terminal target domain-containing protein [Desulfovibrio sp. OttesenSCG-928-I05]